MTAEIALFMIIFTLPAVWIAYNGWMAERELKQHREKQQQDEHRTRRHL